MKRIPRELLVVGITSLLVAISGLFQTLVYVFKTPKGFVYPLVHNFEADFYWYLSLMRQGWDGQILVTSRYSPEIFPGQFVNTFFPFFGLVAHLIHINLPLAYTVLRVLGGGGLLFTSYMLLKELKLPKLLKINGFIFMIFGAPLWFWQDATLRQVGEFWTGFDPILRIAWLPHHTFANLLLIVALIFISISMKNLTEKRSEKAAVSAGIAAAITGWLNPASLLILLISVSVAVILSIVLKSKLTQKNIGSLIVFYGFAAVTIVLLNRVQNSTFPWTAFRDWERYVIYPIKAWDYLQTLGLIGFIAIPGSFLALTKKDFLWNSVIGWFAAPFIGLILPATIIPISNGRYLQGAGYIPAAILAVYFIYVIIHQFLSSRKTRVISEIIITVLIIGFNLRTFQASINRQMMYVGINMTKTNVMIPESWWKAYTLLSNLNMKCGLVLAPSDVSQMLPAFTSCRVVAGHPTLTYKQDVKNTDLNRFYSGDRTGIESVLNTYKPKYIWIPSWMSGKENIGIQRLSIIYQSKDVTIYQNE
jgi:hypothetical protein